MVDISNNNIESPSNVKSYTNDIKQSPRKQNDTVSWLLVATGTILLFIVYVLYFFLDYDTEGKKAVPNIVRLVIIWFVVYFMTFIINFLLNDVTLSFLLFSRIFFIVSLCFWAIAGSTFFIISILPVLVEIFENTIGYAWISMFYDLQGKMNVVKSRMFPNFPVPSEFLITKFDVYNFHDVFYGLISDNLHNNGKLMENANEAVLDFYIDLTDANVNEKEIKDGLYKLVHTKNKIGHMTWIYISSFASLIVALIAMNDTLVGDA
jgi:hypothetical protein